MILDVMQETSITATAGIGTNLYLCKVAMDIVAKHVAPDANGVRIAELDEMTYRKLLWSHRPLTDFWRVGHGYRKKLEEAGLYTMGDITRCSIGEERDYYNEYEHNWRLYKRGKKKSRFDAGRVCTSLRSGTSICKRTGTGEGNCASGQGQSGTCNVWM